MKRPNIIFITCHDLGDYLGCYGTPAATPHLDRLAGEGIRFDTHFSTGTICSPARGSIVTGCYPHTHGLMGLVHRGWALDTKKCPSMAQLLKENGYSTNLFGFQHEHWDPYALGYEQAYQAKTWGCEQVVPLFCDWLEKQKSDKPFLAAVGFGEVHRLGINPSHFKKEGYIAADPAKVDVRPYFPDIPVIREDMAEFYGAVEFMDKWIGRLLEAVEQAGRREDTLIVFTTDHGASFMHSKATLHEGGTKVALAMSWKGGLPEGKVVSGLTSHTDILPTILELLDIPIPAHVEGRSFLKELSGRGDTGRQYAFSEENYNNHFNPGRAMRSARYRYIRHGLRNCLFDFLIPEIELSPFDFRKIPEVFDFYSAHRVQEELYDIQSDPGERVNLAEDPAHSGVLEQMRQALAEHMEQTEDPFAAFKNELYMPAEDYTIWRDRNKG